MGSGREMGPPALSRTVFQKSPSPKDRSGRAACTKVLRDDSDDTSSPSETANDKEKTNQGTAESLRHFGTYFERV